MASTRDTRPHLHSLLPLLAMSVLIGCTGGAPGSGPTALQPSSYSASSFDLKEVPELPVPPDLKDGADQQIVENDILEIDVFQVKDLSRTVQVDSTGRISLPLVGAVEASGKTVRQLEAEIEKAYGSNYLQSPEVTVFVKESHGRRVTIDGEVQKPGIYPTSSRTTLIQIIALAGGFNGIADHSKVYVFRDYGDRKLVANYDVKAIRAGRKADPRIHGGDVVVVFASGMRIAGRNLREALGLASSARSVAPLIP